jgi:hypothetical protein
MRGKGDAWEVVDQDSTTDNFWDLAWFDGSLYASTVRNLYRLSGNDLVAIPFKKDVPKTFYHLSVAPGVMWSIGSKDVMAFDGREWTRIV